MDGRKDRQIVRIMLYQYRVYKNGVAAQWLKILSICLLVLTEYTNVTDRQTVTDGRTPHDGINRLAYS